MPKIGTQRVGHAFKETGTLHITGEGYFWVRTPTEAFGEMAHEYSAAIHQGVINIALRRAPEIENWMKDNAPWTDRTGNARQSLFTVVKGSEMVMDMANKMVNIILSHGVHYGLFLEVSRAGKYAIVNRAIDHWAPIIWADVLRMLGR